MVLPVQQVGLQGLPGLPVVVGQQGLQADLGPWQPPVLLVLLADQLGRLALPVLLEVDLVLQVADLGQLAGLAGQL